MNFKSWLKNELINNPPKSLDSKVLLKSRELLVEEKNYFTLSLSVLTMAMFAVLIFQTRQFSISPAQDPMISKSKEMILNYKEIELMADAGSLSDSDWEQINRD